MGRPEIHLSGTPYIPGVARGIVQSAMEGDVSARIVVSNQSGFALPAILPAGFLIIDAAPFSHAMIPLLACGVPTVMVSPEQAALLENGTEIVLDGSTGIVSTDLSTSVPRVDRVSAAGDVGTDKIDIRLLVSARNAHAARQAAAAKADSIGLVRSEFLLPADGQVPDTLFYRQAFETLCSAAAPLPVTIRLIDIAADKRPAWMPPPDGTSGPLGLQGSRLFSREPVSSVVRAQLAAIDELSGEFDLDVVIPYLDNVEDLLRWKAELERQFSRPTAIGAMAETPAAALQIADWLEIIDFVGLGCNDLMQCLFGADRDLPGLSAYLDPFSPALFRFLRQVADIAREQLHRIRLCGVLPQLPGILPILAGLGFSVFSVESASLNHMRQTIAGTRTAAARNLAERVCNAKTSAQVREMLYRER